MKKRFLKGTAAIMIMASMLFTACGGGGQTTTTTAKTEKAETAAETKDSEKATEKATAESKSSESAAAESKGSESAGTEAEGSELANADDESLQKVLDAGEFILGLDASFKPMGYTDENDEIVGFDLDVAEAVCQKLGVKLVKQPIDWATKEQDLNLGKIDCIWNGMSVDESREKAMNLSEPYMKNQMVFVVAGNSEIKTQDDLKDKTIAVQNGSTAQTILEESSLISEQAELGTPIPITALATNVEALQQLELGLVDAVFMDGVVASYEIKDSGKDYKMLEDGLEESEEEYAIGFRKGDQALRDKVQGILSDLKADGTLAQISTKWFGSDITTVK